MMNDTAISLFRWSARAGAPLVAALLVLLSGPRVAAADQASDFISGLASQAIAVLADKSMSLDARETKLRGLLRDGFALNSIGRIAAGSVWRKMSQEERHEYLALYGEWTLKTYTSRLGGYKGQTLEIIKTIPDGKQSGVIVRSRLVQPGGGEPVNIDWRLRTTKRGTYKIVDVLVTGLSMLVAQKSEFASVSKRHGVAGLMEMLRTRMAALPAISG